MRDADSTPHPAHRRLWRTLALLLCALFVAWVARFYHPGVGFTALLVIPQGHEYEIPALRQLPHYEYPSGMAYDGAMYAQLAMVPLLEDPAIDRALDAPSYRARRVLFCWTAWALGLGQPRWILQAYALQNVLCWLVLAWLAARWLPPDDARGFALWTAAAFAEGLLISVRLALLDGPSLLLLACAARAAERGRPLATGAIVGIAGLGRETNLLGALLLPWPRDRAAWRRTATAALLVIVPLVVWIDYVQSIYWTASPAAGAGQITLPFAAYARKWSLTLQGIRVDGLFSPWGLTLTTVIALTVQAIFVVWTRWWSEPWWRIAAGYAALMALVDWAVWEGHPGAITRVVLPLTFGFNLLLAKREPRRFWIWFVLGNLNLLGTLRMLTRT
jgi:hypothetical protein